MTDQRISPKNNAVKTKPETKIQVESVGAVQEAPLYNQNPPTQQRYATNQSYYSNQTPAYQQRVGGQNVYVAGGSEPQNAARTPMYRQNYPQQQEEYRYYRDNMDEIFTDAFDSVKIRNRFVQRVYMILSVQLIATFAFLALATFQNDVKTFVLLHYMVFLLVGFGIYLVVYLALVCSVNLRRTFPINFIFLGLLTVGFAMLLAPVVAVSPPVAVLSAVGTTALICLLVSLFACQTQWDVTGCGACLCIAGLVLMIYGFVIMILALCGIDVKLLHIIYSALAVLLFVFYLMYDTQMIVGGRRIELSPEEYIFGALTLYVDIMIIFMHILNLYNQCMGGGE